MDRHEYRRQIVQARQERTMRWQQRYLALVNEYGHAFTRLEVGGALKLAKLRWAYRKVSDALPCRVRLIDGTVLDPALIVAPGSTYHERYGYFEHGWWLDANETIVVGGQVQGLEPSSFALPPQIVLAATKRPEIRMSTYIPLLASVRHEAKFLVPAFAVVAECAFARGSEVDPRSAAEPSERTNRLGRYVWFDAMDFRSVRIYANL